MKSVKLKISSRDRFLTIIIGSAATGKQIVIRFGIAFD